MKPLILILTLILTLIPSVGWADNSVLPGRITNPPRPIPDCSDTCPDDLGFNIFGRDARVTYDQRVCFQNCRIANALEQIAERITNERR